MSKNSYLRTRMIQERSAFFKLRELSIGVKVST